MPRRSGRDEHALLEAVPRDLLPLGECLLHRRLRSAQRHPKRAQIWRARLHRTLPCPASFAQLGEPWQAVNVGDQLSIGHLTVRGTGGTHAVIHPELPVIDNISYLVGDREHAAKLMHPGDALFVPDEPVEVLATPAAAPWMKISEAVDYLRAVAPTHAVPIHQGIIDPVARPIFYGRLTEMTDTDFQVLEPESGTEF